MLFVSTRNNQQTYSPQYVLDHDVGPDGGLFLPRDTLAFSAEDIINMMRMSFNQRIAEVLNRIFQLTLTQWDVDFCIGENPVSMVSLRQKTIIVQCWGDTSCTYAQSISKLLKRMGRAGNITESWVRVAVGSAFLAAVLCELKLQGIENPDISCVSGDFTIPLSAWYAKQWGVPVGEIICCCNENKNLWDLIYYGQMRTDTLCQNTKLSEVDVVLPINLERWIFASAGMKEAEHYRECCQRGSVYTIPENIAEFMQSQFAVSVVSSQRIIQTIPAVYRTHQYILSASAALAYAGLQDHKAKRRTNAYALVIAESSPVNDCEWVSDALGITEYALKALL